MLWRGTRRVCLQIQKKTKTIVVEFLVLTNDITQMYTYTVKHNNVPHRNKNLLVLNLGVNKINCEFQG
jgi:hypothetical protein